MTHTYPTENKGALFKNDRKKGEDDPAYRGEIDVGGRPYWISAWLRTSKAGARYLTLAVREKQEAAQPAAQPAARPVRTHSWREDL
jgi:hypothetical protein